MRKALTSVPLGFFIATTAACGTDDFGDCRDTASCAQTDASAGTGASGGSSGRGGNGGNGARGGASGNGGSVGSGGATGGSSGTSGDTGCDLNKSLTADSCAIDEAYGIFVSAQTGSDTADGGTALLGTRQAPFKTIAKGIAAAKAAGKRVYVCADGGNYPEAIVVGAALDGLEVYGGFRCATWEYSATLKAAVVSPQPTAVTSIGLSTGLRLEDLDITAADATTDGGSSFGMIVANSQNVVLRRVRIVAGVGKAGAVGTNGTPGANGSEPGVEQWGRAASCNGDAGASQLGGSWPRVSECGSEGGVGGSALRNSEPDGGKGVYGSPRVNVTPAGADNGGAGQTASAVADGGKVGSPGNVGPNGPAAPQRGTFTATGFTLASGNNGTNGYPGQGGGGGGASKGGSNCLGASGGAGGMGGCGGTRGAAGGGGGASVALLSWMSSVTLDASELVAKNGGAGGKGGDAGPGGSGGDGAPGGGNGGTALGAAGGGGDGGQGGPGGSGSGGTGGPSHALVYQGVAPIKGGTNLMAASGGAKGIGGMIAGGTKAADGTDGASDTEYQQP